MVRVKSAVVRDVDLDESYSVYPKQKRGRPVEERTETDAVGDVIIEEREEGDYKKLGESFGIDLARQHRWDVMMAKCERR